MYFIHFKCLKWLWHCSTTSGDSALSSSNDEGTAVRQKPSQVPQGLELSGEKQACSERQKMDFNRHLTKKTDSSFVFLEFKICFSQGSLAVYAYYIF